MIRIVSIGCVSVFLALVAPGCDRDKPVLRPLAEKPRTQQGYEATPREVPPAAPSAVDPLDEPIEDGESGAFAGEGSESTSPGGTGAAIAEEGAEEGSRMEPETARAPMGGEVTELAPPEGIGKTAGSSRLQAEREPTEKVDRGFAEFEAEGDRKVKGEIALVEEKGRLVFRGTLTGLEPGWHGFHVHQKGDCSGKGFSAAGDHFAPAGGRHAGPKDPGAHAGDLGNVYADEGGTAKVEISTSRLVLSGGPNAVLNRALIVHAKKDDFQSQPAGASGDPIACAVIEAAPAGEQTTEEEGELPRKGMQSPKKTFPPEEKKSMDDLPIPDEPGPTKKVPEPPSVPEEEEEQLPPTTPPAPY